MTSIGYFRGHQLIWQNNKWIYADTLEDIPANGGEIRPCAKCGSLFSIGEVDSCMGILPDCNNACCGHGIDSQAYIRFNNGMIFTNFKFRK